MALPPQKFREIVYQVLFCQTCVEQDLVSLVTMIMREMRVSRRWVLQAFDRVSDVCEHLEEVDKILQATTTSYRMERIHRAELTAIRLGIFELLYDDEIPSAVAITEAMRLSRKFGAPEGAAFVNAILDNIHQGQAQQAVEEAEAVI